jgi:hypothetical protein
VRKSDGSYEYAAMSYSNATDLLLSLHNNPTQDTVEELLNLNEYPQLWVKLPAVQGPTATAAAAAATAGAPARAALPTPSGSSSGQTSTATAAGNPQPQRKRKAGASNACAAATYVGPASGFALCLQASLEHDVLEACAFSYIYSVWTCLWNL